MPKFYSDVGVPEDVKVDISSSDWVKDDDTMGGVTPSDTHLATQQSIKAYVDSKEITSLAGFFYEITHTTTSAAPLEGAIRTNNSDWDSVSVIQFHKKDTTGTDRTTFFSQMLNGGFLPSTLRFENDDVTITFNIATAWASTNYFQFNGSSSTDSAVETGIDSLTSFNFAVGVVGVQGTTGAAGTADQDYIDMYDSVTADAATVAADKATVAADKATVAADKAIVAADKATVAADKTAAAGSATDAGASAASASGSASTATTQAAAASSSATAAGNAQTAAEAAQAAAETAETNAEAAETAAEGFRDELTTLTTSTTTVGVGGDATSSYNVATGVLTLGIPTGATGGTGGAGTNGNDGADGKTVLNGSGAPDNANGENGDFYIDTNGDNIHGPKAGGTWPAAVSLVGPQGAVGATGATGNDGTSVTLAHDGDNRLTTATGNNTVQGETYATFVNTSNVSTLGVLSNQDTRDKFEIATTTSGATTLTTTDDGGAAAHLGITADGNVDVDGLVVTLDAATSIELEGATNIHGDILAESTNVSFISKVSSAPTLSVVNSNTDAAVPEILLGKFQTDDAFSTPASAADGDEIGDVVWLSLNDADEQIIYAKMKGYIEDVGNGDEAGKLEIEVAASDGTAKQMKGGITLTGRPDALVVDIDIAEGANSLTSVAGSLNINGSKLKFDSVTLTGIQTGSESFVDDDISLMTSAAIKAKIDSSGLGTSFSSADLLGALTDETGTGSAVFASDPTLSNPTLVGPALGTPASGYLVNCHGINYYEHVKTAGTTAGDTGAGAEIVKFGTGTVVAGKIYQYSGGAWALADADAESTSSKLLGVALSGGDASSVGMCVRGMVTLAADTTGDDGDVLWLETGATGGANDAAPTSAGDIARIIGYCLDDNGQIIFFNPDSTFVEVA
jgi:hypothetical protein